MTGNTNGEIIKDILNQLEEDNSEYQEFVYTIQIINILLKQAEKEMTVITFNRRRRMLENLEITDDIDSIKIAEKIKTLIFIKDIILTKIEQDIMIEN